MRDRRPVITQPSSVAPGGAGSRRPSAGPASSSAPCCRRRGRRCTGVGREVRVERQAEQAAVPEVVDVALRSATVVGVVSARLSKTLIRPPFSATNDAPVGREADRRRRVQPAERHGLREAGRDRRGGGGELGRRSAEAGASNGCAASGLGRGGWQKRSGERQRDRDDGAGDHRATLRARRVARPLDLRSGNLVPRHQRWQRVERVAAVVPAGRAPHLEVQVAGRASPVRPT